MRLSALARLPASLLAVSLALLVASAPAQTTDEPKSIKLTPDTFSSSTASGTWFIEFFSPYCHHCRAFAPTWQQLVEDVAKISEAPLTMAQVNCAMHGDLCRELKIDGYPQLNIYQDGKFVENFGGAREHNLLTEFMSKYLGPTPISPESEYLATEPVVHINPSGEVLVLTDENFPDVIGKGRVFVKYFAPWCGHCKKLAPTWKQLAQQMKNQLTIAEVDCEAHGSLCRSQDIQGYPMLFYYGVDGTKTEYNGGRNLNQLDAFVEKLIAPAVQEITYETFDAQVQTNEVMYLLLRSPSDTQSIPIVTKASSVLLGSPPVFVSASEALVSHLSIPPSSLPMLIALKDGDVSKPAATIQLQPNHGADTIKAWFLRHRFPTALTLDSENFQQIMNPKQAPSPLVVIAVSLEKNRLETMNTMKRIGKQWREENAKRVSKDVVFAWIDAEKWAKWLKSMYGITGVENAQVPAIVIVNHNQLIYYDVDASGAKIAPTTSSIISTLEGILSGSIAYKNSENILERLVRYLNDKLTLLETFVKNNPRTVILFGCSVLVLFVLFVRWLLSDGDDYDYIVKNRRQGHVHLKKSNRVD